MPFDDAQLHAWYEELVRSLRRKGVLCGITSGLACVHYDVAETTKDCDLLCSIESFAALFTDLAQRRIEDLPCGYRGNLTPPLDARWHRGGWTSHFCWGRGPDTITLDIFGCALRATVDWEEELAGLYVSPHIVSEMKRTNRDKDWPFITSLGVRMLETGDLYDMTTLEKMLVIHPCPEQFLKYRPALALAKNKDPRAQGALHVERRMWEQLDELRIGIYQRAVRPYLAEVRRARVPETAPLEEQHGVRVAAAVKFLPVSPLRDHGLDRLLAEAKKSLITRGFVAEDAFLWLPDFMPHFNYLSS